MIEWDRETAKIFTILRANFLEDFDDKMMMHKIFHDCKFLVLIISSCACIVALPFQTSGINKNYGRMVEVLNSNSHFLSIYPPLQSSLRLQSLPVNILDYDNILEQLPVQSQVVMSQLSVLLASFPTVNSVLWTSFFDSAPPPAANVADDFLQQVEMVSVDSFLASLSSRLIGTLIGNILAGIAFKIIFDKVEEMFRSRRDEAASGAVTFNSNNNNNNSDNINNKSDVVAPNRVASTPEISLSAWSKLLICIGIDLVSDSSFLLPGVGEAEDVAWAPLSAFLLKNLFDSNTVGGIEFVKEILPFTDIIPLATSVWLLENVFKDTRLAKTLGVGRKD